jgi:hypothetical protein
VGQTPYKHGKPYSDKLSLAAKEFKKKKTLLRYLIHKRDVDRNSHTEDAVKTQLRDAYRELKVVQCNAELEQEKFLHKLADKQAGEWNLSQNAALNVILQAEASKKTYARHGAVMKK